jgi:hypothetical protein
LQGKTEVKAEVKAEVKSEAKTDTYHTGTGRHTNTKRRKYKHAKTKSFGDDGRSGAFLFPGESK